MMTLHQAASACQGKLYGPDVTIRGITTDSRASCDGQLFLALEGQNFDAHEFLEQAQEQGAVAVLVNQNKQLPKSLSVSSISCSDTLRAYGAIAAWWRSQYDIPVIGVTGSVGKTTLKGMLASIFEQQQGDAANGLITEGNLNNEIGVPRTLLRLLPSHHYAIIEMGMNAPGEIRRLSAMAKPSVAVVNNAAAAHLEGLGSLDAIAAAKGEIFEHLVDNGIAVLNRDSDYYQYWKTSVGDKKTISFGLSTAADVSCRYALSSDHSLIEISTAEQTCNLRLRAVGKHMVLNALAATATSLAAGLDLDQIRAGLEQFQAVEGRQVIRHFGSTQLIDDTYNANPASVSAALHVLANVLEAKRKIAVLGDMGELGDATEIEHQKIGRLAKALGIDTLLAVGEFSAITANAFGENGFFYANHQSMAESIAAVEWQEAAVLVKGSRTAKMEIAVAAITKQLSTGEIC